MKSCEHFTSGRQRVFKSVINKSDILHRQHNIDTFRGKHFNLSVSMETRSSISSCCWLGILSTARETASRIFFCIFPMRRESLSRESFCGEGNEEDETGMKQQKLGENTYIGHNYIRDCLAKGNLVWSGEVQLKSAEIK